MPASGCSGGSRVYSCSNSLKYQQCTYGGRCHRCNQLLWPLEDGQGKDDVQDGLWFPIAAWCVLTMLMKLRKENRIALLMSIKTLAKDAVTIVMPMRVGWAIKMAPREGYPCSE
jgi:hypothetical protein